MKLLIGVSLCVAAQAQVLSNGPLGKQGAQAVLVSENRLFVDGDQLNVGYVQYVRGLSSRADLYISVGETRTFRQNQAFVGIGGVVRLARVAGTDVVFCDVTSLPLHRRRDASTLSTNPALIVSREVRKGFAIYSGVNALIPIGAIERGLFTSPTYKVNVPIGFAITHGHWTVFPEVDIGRLKAIGVGIVWAK